MKKITYILTCFVLVAISFSCTDQSTFNNPSIHELENGAYIRFANNPPATTVSDPQNISFSDEIFDPNGNTADYTVALKATIGGTDHINDNYFNATSFPATFTITSQLMADAIGVPVENFSFGDLFEFTATTIRTDGVVFYGITPSFDADTGTVGIGNTESNLINSPAMNSAMKFSIIVACASHVAADMPGMWTVVQDDWADYAPGDQIEVVAGPDDHTFHILATNNPFISNPDTAYMIITVDDAGTVIEATSNEPFNFGPLIVPEAAAGGGGLVFSCVGVIDLFHDWLSPDHTLIYGGGNSRLVLNKN